MECSKTENPVFSGFLPLSGKAAFPSFSLKFNAKLKSVRSGPISTNLAGYKEESVPRQIILFRFPGTRVHKWKFSRSKFRTIIQSLNGDLLKVTRSRPNSLGTKREAFRGRKYRVFQGHLSRRGKTAVPSIALLFNA